jgi:hypothetical protein
MGGGVMAALLAARLWKSVTLTSFALTWKRWVIPLYSSPPAQAWIPEYGEQQHAHHTTKSIVCQYIVKINLDKLWKNYIILLSE